MRVKKKFAAVLSVLLILSGGFPAFAVTVDGLEEPEAPVILYDNGDADTPPNESQLEENNQTELPAEDVEPPTDISDTDLPEAVEASPPEEEENSAPQALTFKAESDPPQVPSFTAELKQNSEGWGLYGRLSEIASDMAEVIPCYSFDDEEYIPEPYNAWQLGTGDPYLRQQSYWQFEEPLASYLAGEVNRFYFCMKIIYTDDSVAYTQPVMFEREGPVALPDDYLVHGLYGSSVRMVDDQLPQTWGEYHFTALNTASSEELAALLPEQVPVELQVYKEGQVGYTTEVNYTTIWPTELPGITGERTEIAAQGITPPEECEITIGTDVYRIGKTRMEAATFPGPDLKVVVHAVESGTRSEIKLSNGDRGLETDGIRATFPLKPTGATSITSEYSLDGGESWTPLSNILRAFPLETTPPKVESYTATFLLPGSQLLEDYLTGAIDGFYIRMRIDGGVFDGVSETEAWPTDYQYTPPPPSVIPGSGGNENNAGSHKRNDSVNNGGQRPYLPDAETAPPVDTAPLETALEQAQQQPILGESIPPEVILAAPAGIDDIIPSAELSAGPEPQEQPEQQVLSEQQVQPSTSDQAPLLGASEESADQGAAAGSMAQVKADNPPADSVNHQGPSAKGVLIGAAVLAGGGAVAVGVSAAGATAAGATAAGATAAGASAGSGGASAGMVDRLIKEILRRFMRL